MYIDIYVSMYIDMYIGHQSIHPSIRPTNQSFGFSYMNFFEFVFISVLFIYIQIQIAILHIVWYRNSNSIQIKELICKENKKKRFELYSERRTTLVQSLNLVLLNHHHVDVHC